MMYLAIVFLPLIGAAIAGLLPMLVREKGAMLITTGLLIVSAVLSLYAFYDVAYLGHEKTVEVARWIDLIDLRADWKLRIDTLTAVMLVVVTFVSCLVHIYSWGYMAEDPGKPRFFSYLSLFTFAMLMLVTSDNFLQMFFGWEGVGLASYLLIGFWYKKPSANAAAVKAFVTNRVGDFGFALGIMTVFTVFGSVSYDTVFSQLAEKSHITFHFMSMDVNAIELAGFLLFIGAMGKSAQFFLHVWLPDAMEGPTPVSALIHAATMVTAGVFLVVRCAPLYELAPHASTFITVIGAVTAFFAATVGLVQNDIKRVIAYSTCSQLGYMFFAAGLGFYGAAMFHLFTHAFFKALLFLSAGSVIVGMHHEQDMRNMGGLRSKMPYTYAMMLIGTFALTGLGIPGTNIGAAGFFSKDAIIEGAWAAGEAGKAFGYPAFWVGVIAALMTSFYSWRVVLMTFHGKPRGDGKAVAHAHESPVSMLLPLTLLAVGALFAGVMFKSDFVGDNAAHFWRGSTVVSPLEKKVSDEDFPVNTSAHVEEASHAATGHAGVASHAEAAHVEGGHHEVPMWVLWSPFAAMALGFAFAWWLYIPDPARPKRWADNSHVIHPFLYNKWYFDEIYEFVFNRGLRKLGTLLWKGVDQQIIDHYGPNGFATITRRLARAASRMQTGYVYHYAFLMLTGLVVFLTWILMRGTGGH